MSKGSSIFKRNQNFKVSKKKFFNTNDKVMNEWCKNNIVSPI